MTGRIPEERVITRAQAAGSVTPRTNRFLSKTILLPLLLMLLCGAQGKALRAGELEDINAAIRLKGADWVAAETTMSKLAADERRNMMSVLVDTTVSSTAPKIRALPSGTGEPPVALDWRNYGGHSYVTGVRDQKSCGACWAFSMVATLESRVLRDTGHPDGDLDLAEQFLISCSGIGCSLGSTMENAAAYVLANGIPPEKCYPFVAGDGTCASACADWKSRVYGITGFTSVVKTSDDLRRAVAAYGVISAAMLVYDDFMSYKSGVYKHVFGNVVGWHGINIVGYDDNERYFIGKNTWGKGWGENGFFRISYEEIPMNSNFGTSALAFDGTVIPAVTDPIPDLEPDQPATPSNPPTSQSGSSTSGINIGEQRGGSSCFIATAAYGSSLSPEIRILKDFRDRYLMENAVGRRIVQVYYRFSPSIATFIASRPSLRFVTRSILTPIVYGLKHPVATLCVLLSICCGFVALGFRIGRLRGGNGLEK